MEKLYLTLSHRSLRAGLVRNEFVRSIVRTIYAKPSRLMPPPPNLPRRFFLIWLPPSVPETKWLFYPNGRASLCMTLSRVFDLATRTENGLADHASKLSRQAVCPCFPFCPYKKSTSNVRCQAKVRNMKTALGQPLIAKGQPLLATFWPLPHRREIAMFSRLPG